jgi:hypothetical protein
VKGLLCATVAILVSIQALVLASGARAEAVVQPRGSTPVKEALAPPLEVAAGEGATSPEGGAGTPTTGETASGEAASAAEEAPPATEATPPPEAEPPPSETPLGSQEATPPAEEALPPAEEATPPAEEATPPAEEVVPVQEVVQTTQEVAPVTKEVVEPVSEVITPVVSVEERLKPLESTKEAAQTEQAVSPVAVSPAQPSLPQAAATSTPAPAPLAADVADAVVASLPRTPADAAGSPRTTSSPVPVGALAGLTAAQRAGELTCELSGLTERLSERCSADLLSSASLLAVVPGEPAQEVSRARKSTHAGGGYSEPAGGGRSVMPPPGPAPGGSFGGSAGAGSGAALSGSFTHMGLFIFAAPCSMHRLRLSCRPWRTAFFVLIPERPG